MRVQPYFILSPSERRAGSAVVVRQLRPMSHWRDFAHGAGALSALKECAPGCGKATRSEV